MGKLKDLTGQQFGQWTVLYRDTDWDKIRKNYSVKWICQCSCGTIRSVQANNLLNNSTQSCGCEKNKKFTEMVKDWNAKKKEEDIFCIKEDLTGKIFSNITVLELDIEKSKEYREQHGKNSKIFWKCQCSCGTIFSPTGNDLKSGKTTSCGCNRKFQSKGANKIENMLKENNIRYRKEVTFSDLKDIRLLRYDFAILDDKNNIIQLIEYDGEQHSQINSCLFNTSELKKHDEMKNEYAKQHNIPLKRIDFSEIDNITSINQIIL